MTLAHWFCGMAIGMGYGAAIAFLDKLEHWPVYALVAIVLLVVFAMLSARIEKK